MWFAGFLLPRLSGSFLGDTLRISKVCAAKAGLAEVWREEELNDGGEGRSRTKQAETVRNRFARCTNPVSRRPADACAASGRTKATGRFRFG